MVEALAWIGGAIVLVGGVAYALHLIWVHFIKPVARALKSLGLFIEAQPTLLEIAHEFKKNNGETLRDQIDGMKMQVNNIEQQMEQLVQQVGRWDGEERRTS